MECNGFMGFVFGHKFKPIITRKATKFDSSGIKCKDHIALEMADKYRDEEYHGSVCSRCGATIAGDSK